MRVEFFSGSRLCSKRFFYRCASFPSLSKSAIPHSNSIKRVVKGIFVTRDRPFFFPVKCEMDNFSP